MKKLLLLTLALSLPLAQMVRADNDKDRKKHKRQAEAAAVQRGQQGARPAAHAVRRPVQTTQRRAAPNQPSIVQTPHSLANERAAAQRPHTVAPAQRQEVKSEARLDGRNHSGNQVSKNRNRNVDRNQTSVRRDHRNFDRNSFSVARSHVIRTPHHRNWWRSHYNTTFILFGGGYYYWWNNYWYPAYGYSPYYNNYIYSEPIYGYNNLAPGQVIENVQIALRDAGYYPGAIDGLVGPQTRAALAAYQRDHGLVVTEAVDEPTLVTLGLA
jgi:hypothetical protein